MSDLRYPIGPFQPKLEIADHERREFLSQVREAPARLRAAVEDLSSSQLDTPYRPKGWTVRQVVHHIPDSHLNWYIRVKLALTEDEPTIKPFDEVRWAELEDARVGPVQPSLLLLDALHERCVLLLESLTPAEWSCKLFHPESGLLTVEATLSMYAWHGRHHIAHITELRKRMGWV